MKFIETKGIFVTPSISFTMYINLIKISGFLAIGLRILLFRCVAIRKMKNKLRKKFQNISRRGLI